MLELSKPCSSFLTYWNVLGARGSDDPNLEWGVVTAVAARAQIRSCNEETIPLKMKEVKGKMLIRKIS